MLKVTALVLFTALPFAPVGALAEDNADPGKPTALEIAEMGKRVSIANGLIAMGRKDGDPQLIAVGARILAELNVGVVDPATVRNGEKRKFHDPRALMEGVKAMKGGKDAAMTFKLPSGYSEPAQSTCYWNYYCDSFFCGEYWDCGQGPPGWEK